MRRSALVMVLVVLFAALPSAAGEIGFKEGIDIWMKYYNEERPHSSHEDLTPIEAYLGLGTEGKAA